MVIEELRSAILAGISIEYSVHCQKRMLERNISREDIRNCILNGEIIEDYPLDENNTSELSLPACLVLWVDTSEKGAIHVVVGYNGYKMLFISAYFPNELEWESDFKTRKGM